MELPFNVGEVKWKAICQPYPVEVPCPTCYGALRVTLKLGNGDLVDVECEGCGKGFDRPRGTVSEYRYEAKVEKFVIQGLQGVYGDQISVSSTLGSVHRLDELFNTEAEALAHSQVTMARAVESQMRNNEGKTKHQRANLTWTVQYHEKCIHDMEKRMEWHRSKISERRKKP